MHAFIFSISFLHVSITFDDSKKTQKSSLTLPGSPNQPTLSFLNILQAGLERFNLLDADSFLLHDVTSNKADCRKKGEKYEKNPHRWRLTK